MAIFRAGITGANPDGTLTPEFLRSLNGLLPTAKSGYLLGWGATGNVVNINPDDLIGVRVAVLGDSMAATNNLIDPAWPDQLAARLDSLGAAVDLHNLAKDGHTFNKANTVATFGTLTMVQQAIALAPDVVIVALGANDAILNIEGRTLLQVKADAATLFTALRTALPNAVILYASELMHDATNFATPGTTLKNKGTAVYFWQTKTAGILTGFITPECLEDSVSAGQKTNFGNWVSLDTYVKTLTTISGNYTLPYFKAARLGLVGVDNIHLTAMGQLYLASAGVKAFYTSTALDALFPVMMTQAYDPWNDPDVIFSSFLAASGDGWAAAAYDSQVFQASKNAGLWARINPDVWYVPSKAIAKFSPTTFTADNLSAPGWQITNARPMTAVDVSVDGAAFGSAGRTTDEYGCASYPFVGGMFPAATYVVRYKVGNEVFGPYTLTAQAPAEPHLYVKQAAIQATGAGGWYAPNFATTVESTAVTWVGAVATIQRAGRYAISAQVGLDAVPAGAYILTSVYVGGVRTYDGNLSFNAAAGVALLSSVVGVSARLAVGATVQIQVLTGAASGNITPGTGASTYFTISWMGF